MTTSPLDAMRAPYRQPMCKKSRKRKPRIRSMIREAEKDGKAVTSVTLPDGTTLAFGETSADDSAASELAKWRKRRARPS
jgi:hypothetical protein